MPLRNPPRQRVEVASGGTLIGKRRRINFVSNATVVDDPANDEVDVTPGGGGGGGTPGGSVTELQFHDTGTTFGGDPQLTWNKTTNVLTVTGTVAATTLTGAGAGITALDAGNIATGSLSDARLSANVALESTVNTFTVGQVIDGTANAIQLRIQGHTSQTQPLLTLETSAGTDVFTVSNGGDVVAANYTGAQLTAPADTNLLITAGTVGANGKNVTIQASGDGPSSSDGGSINMTAGNATDSGGSLVGTGSSLIVGGGDSTGVDDGVGGSITATAGGGSGLGTGGSITFNAAANGGSVVFNEPGSAVNFRVESDTDANCLTVNGTSNCVGLGTITALGGKLNFVAATTAAGGIVFGTDVNLYRSAANVLTTDDAFSAASFSGSGSGLTAVPATSLTGTISDARLSANVVLEDAANVFTVSQVIDGTADAIQLRIQGHSTQTNPLLTLETSAGTDVLTVSNAGAAVLLGGLTAASLTTAGAVTADTLSVSGIAFDTLGEATFPAAVIAAEMYADILSSADEVSAIDIATPIDVTGAVTSTASFNRVGNLAVGTTMATPTNGHVLTWVTANSQWEAAASAGGGGTPGGADTNVQFNNAGAFGGEAAFAYNITTNILTIGGGEVIASGTLTDPLLALSITQTWNDAADTFVARRTNITDTASAAASLLDDWQIAGVSVAKLDKAGGFQATSILVDAPASTQLFFFYRHAGLNRFTYYVQADGSSWNVARYNDAGAYVEDSISLARATGIVTFAQPIVGSAASMTAIPAGQLTGTVADARLTGNVALEDAANTFTAAQTIAAGTITTSQPGISLTQTWNAGGVTFKAFFLNATDTASAAGSLLMELRADNVVRFSVDKAGTVNTGDILAGDVTALDVTATNLIGSGAAITALDAGNIATGSLADARLSSNVALENITNTFTAAQVIDGTADAIQLRIQGHSTQTSSLLVLEQSDGTDVATVSNAGAAVFASTVTATVFSGSGASLTAVPATSLTGTIDDARLSANVALENVANVFTVGQMVDGTTNAVQLTVQGHSTQTAAIFTVETSAGTDVFTVSNAGAGVFAAGVTATLFVGNSLTAVADNNLAIAAGAAATTGKNVTVTASGGNGDDLAGGAVTITAGLGTGTAGVTTGAGAVVTVGGGTGTDSGRGGNIDLAPGLGANGGTNGEVVVNEAGAAVNFRVESDTNANIIFVNGTSNFVTIGATTNLGGIFGVAGSQVIDGTADAIQLRIQGNATQTTDLLTLEKSDGVDVLTVSNAGKLKSVIRVPTIVTLTNAAPISVDASLGELFRITLDASRTIGNPSNPTDGQIIRIQYKQDATGSRVLTHGTSAGGYRFGTDPLTAIVLSTAASTIDEVVYEYRTDIDRWIVQSFNKGIVGT